MLGSLVPEPRVAVARVIAGSAVCVTGEETFVVRRRRGGDDSACPAG